MIIEHPATETGYRWVILTLAMLTNTLATAVPGMCLPVLFNEISNDLHLDLVQVGLVWGISALPGVVTVLLGGAIGDRFGPKRVLIAGCVLVGVTGALRGLATNFIGLAAAMFLMGVVSPLISMNTLKMCSMWFSRRQLGLASGFMSMGMALGFLAASLLSASVLSPWLGGWRNVLFLYGGISAALCIPWLLTRPAPMAAQPAVGARPVSLGKTMLRIASIRKIWLLGLAILGIGGCVQGTLGYLPLYLRGMGWSGPNADVATAAFHTASLLCTIPIALASDRLGTRKKVLAAAGMMMLMGVGLLSVAQGALVWLAVVMAGMVRDGFMAVFMTYVIETEGVGITYAGTATGMVMVFSGVGNLLAPPIGNSLAATAPGLPFIFWASLIVVGFAGLFATREREVRPALAVP
jgi:MFS family permease